LNRADERRFEIKKGERERERTNGRNDYRMLHDYSTIDTKRILNDVMDQSILMSITEQLKNYFKLN
jgi:hypothetical protein